jgi:uncharacterized protein YndB with AHSA1/START domain
MTKHSVLHSTFTLTREYSAPPQRVYDAWADPAAKARWFGAGSEHELDFRVDGRETIVTKGEPVLRFEAVYHDIVPCERLVYSSTMFGDGELATVSLTTVWFEADGEHTRLVLTEQGTFLDGKESPDWRERGTGDWLDALATHLAPLS